MKKPWNEKQKQEAVMRLYKMIRNQTGYFGRDDYVFGLFSNGSFMKIAPEEMKDRIKQYQKEKEAIELLTKWANTNRRAFEELGPEEYRQIQALIAAEQVIKE